MYVSRSKAVYWNCCEFKIVKIISTVGTTVSSRQNRTRTGHGSSIYSFLVIIPSSN